MFAILFAISENVARKIIYFYFFQFNCNLKRFCSEKQFLFIFGTFARHWPEAQRWAWEGREPSVLASAPAFPASSQT